MRARIISHQKNTWIVVLCYYWVIFFRCPTQQIRLHGHPPIYVNHFTVYRQNMAYLIFTTRMMNRFVLKLVRIYRKSEANKQDYNEILEIWSQNLTSESLSHRFQILPYKSIIWDKEIRPFYLRFQLQIYNLQSRIRNPSKHLNRLYKLCNFVLRYSSRY